MNGTEAMALRRAIEVRNRPQLSNVFAVKLGIVSDDIVEVAEHPRPEGRPKVTAD